jgi:hypothetical protein
MVFQKKGIFGRTLEFLLFIEQPLFYFFKKHQAKPKRRRHFFFIDKMRKIERDIRLDKRP